MKKHAALYIRTTADKGRHQSERLIENTSGAINAELERLTAYADARGFNVAKVYLDDEDVGIMSPAFSILLRDCLTRDYDAVFISNEDAVDTGGSHNELSMNAIELGDKGIALYLVDEDIEAVQYCREHGREWLLADLDEGRRQADAGEYLSIEEVDEALKRQSDESTRQMEKAMAAAQPVEEMSQFGANVIEARKALWLLKNGYKQEVVMESALLRR